MSEDTDRKSMQDTRAFLEPSPDILRFGALGTTEQDGGTQFRVDYLKPSGAIGFYHPDWVAVQKASGSPRPSDGRGARGEGGEVSWIIETKGRVWEGTDAKDAAIADWCKKVSAQTKTTWRYKRIDQIVFGARNFDSFTDLIAEVDSRKRPPTPS